MVLPLLRLSIGPHRDCENSDCAQGKDEPGNLRVYVHGILPSAFGVFGFRSKLRRLPPAPNDRNRASISLEDNFGWFAATAGAVVIFAGCASATVAESTRL